MCPSQSISEIEGGLCRISPNLYKANKTNEERVSALGEVLDKHGLSSKSLRADCQV